MLVIIFIVPVNYIFHEKKYKHTVYNITHDKNKLVNML
jgi:hypothetical protein